MGEISVPFVFSSGTTIVASEHNSNNSTVYGEVNGELENVNIKANAGIVGSKLNLAAAGNIGATTPATGKFSTLEATTTLKLELQTKVIFYMIMERLWLD